MFRLFVLEISKFLGTSFLQNTSGNCFCKYDLEKPFSDYNKIDNNNNNKLSIKRELCRTLYLDKVLLY